MSRISRGALCFSAPSTLISKLPSVISLTSLASFGAGEASGVRVLAQVMASFQRTFSAANAGDATSIQAASAQAIFPIRFILSSQKGSKHSPNGLDSTLPSPCNRQYGF
ncbi:MAG: hypothetical protein ACD_75C00068G0001 [uncultured bacterium]|nr:MAG: hypothetical protein ACD_75C00068G0001 [uncultured bacterium]